MNRLARAMTVKIKTIITTFFAIALVCSSTIARSETTRSENIESATSATVLIKTHLKHGFLEDDQSDGRWEGSGFLINKQKGWILTNAHVAGFGPVTLRVRFEGQEKFASAERVFVDSKHDVAVVRIESDQIPEESTPLELDCSYQLSRGDSVFSIGHPEDQDFTSSLGVLSGEKDFHVDGSFFTTDLVTESGSSGGPVILEKTNKVVGMMTSGFTSSDLGFLTKSSDICRITNLLEQGENPARPRFEFQTLVDNKKLSSFVGAVFDRSLELETGDEILSWNGNLWNPNIDGDLGDVMRGYDGDRVQLSVLRDGFEQLVEVPVKQGKSYHEKDWVFFSGLTITEDDKQDAAFGMGNTNAPVLIIESIDTNFDDSNDVEFGDGSEVVMLDDLSGVSLRTLYDYLNERKDDDRVEVIARVYDWSPEAYSSLMRHSFEVEKLDCSWCD